MARTEREDLQAAIAHAQEVDPWNVDDAEYILAHPAEFDGLTRARARDTERNHYRYGES